MQTPVIGMVGRYHPQKDHGNLIEAMRLLKQERYAFTCLLVGDSLTEGNIELNQLIRQAGIDEHVRLLGPRTDIVAIMNALDIHVLSSLGEAFPNVLAEAMACGTPCVTTDVGDAALIIGDTGWVVPVRNSRELADGLAAALTAHHAQPEGWPLRQNACRERITAKFSMTSMLAAYQKLWNEVVETEVAASAQSAQNKQQTRP
jgi:glycosyltransferase involved in cell wall biosynthesis